MMKQELTALQTGRPNAIQELVQGMKIRDLKNYEPIKDQLRYVFAITGLKNIPSTERRGDGLVPSEQEILLDYIRNNFQEFAPGEIREAFVLATSGKLDLKPDEVKHYENFSCEYFGRIMSAYKKHRGIQLTRTYAKTPFAKYEGINDYLEKELFAPYQLIRQGSEVSFDYYQAWRLFNFLRNKKVLSVLSPSKWLKKAEEYLTTTKRRNPLSSAYRPTTGEIDYQARVMFFNFWIREQAKKGVNLRELI